MLMITLAAALILGKYVQISYNVTDNLLSEARSNAYCKPGSALEIGGRAPGQASLLGGDAAAAVTVLQHPCTCL
jgi:hypothetical protein